MTRDVMQWLREARNLDAALLDHMGVKAVDHPSLGRAVAFPYDRNGKPYAAKFRTEAKAFRSSEGVSRGLYNADALTEYQDQPVVITEGEIDCLSVMQAGFLRAVSLPDGWTPEGTKAEALLEAQEALEAAPFVIVAGDNDEAGASLPSSVANILDGSDVRYCEWPEGCKDPNDVLVRFGEGELAACLNAAKRIDPPGGFITALSDLPPLPERRVLRTGLSPFDRVVALECGAMSVWTGVPGSGKSTFLTWAAERVSQEENIRVGLMAFETHPHTTRDQLSRIRTGQSFRDLSEDQKGRLLETLDRRFRIVHQTFDETQHHIGWLKSMVHTLAVRERCKLIIVDPWNELEHLPEPGENMTSYINFATKTIRQWARKLDVHIALVAHPKKINSDNGIPRAPTGYDVADSAAFYNKPALGVTVHQAQDQDGDSYVKLVVWKVRETLLYGFSKSTVSVDFDPITQRYARRQSLPSTPA
ncbi:AAA family ATPase [Dinoroseobacter sp. S124A]|uniref:AAA family ATPase n=1 Tax=Dinoroseobacter sp. S124A TaxID=3415128 RepID=UPI003C7DF313